MLTPVTPPCYLTISQSEKCTQVDHIPCDPSPSWPLKCFAKPLGGLKVFQGMSHLVSLYGLAINLSLLQTPTFQFVWPHHALGT